MEHADSPRLVVVGASAGGIEALSTLVATVPADFGAPIVVGPSRKSFIAKAASFSAGDTRPSEDAPPSERLGGTIAACLAAADAGADMLRVHDVFAVGQALLVHQAIRGAHA